MQTEADRKQERKLVNALKDSTDDFSDPLTSESSFNLESVSFSSLMSSQSHSQSQLDPQLASLRIFSAFVLKSWRRQRERIKRLTEKVEQYEKGSMKAQNQMHVCNTLFRVEQKRNEQLQCQLARTLESLKQAKSTVDGLNSSIKTLENDKFILEQELQERCQGLEDANEILSQTKTDLFRSMVAQRNLHASLCEEQRSVQFLETQRTKLVTEIYQMSSGVREAESRYNRELCKKDDEIRKANERIKKLEKNIYDLTQRKTRLEQYLTENRNLKQEMMDLQSQLATLQLSNHENLFYNGLRDVWCNLVFYHNLLVKMLTSFSHTLLPASPLQVKPMKAV